MAETAILAFLLEKLYSLFQIGGQNFKKVHEEVDFVRGKLEQMRTFYRAAIARDEMEPELENFVGKVRDVLFSTEDVLDQLSLDVANNSRRGFCRSLQPICSCFRRQKACYQYASIIHGLKLEVSTILEQLLTYNISNKDRGSISCSADDKWRDYREQALLLEDHELVGIDRPREQLVDWLTDDDSRLKVIAICGMGGLGKTTLVKKVYDDTRVQNHFQFHVWITVSQSFQIHELLNDMVQQLYGEIKQPIPQGVENMKTSRLKEHVKQFLRESSYVIVLDDVWSVDAWNSIKHVFPKGNGGRIMLTTRTASVASISSKEFNGHNYELKALSWEESEELFFTRTFKRNHCPPHLLEVSQSILKKCEGLPLAIVAISGLLLTMNDSLTDWQMVDRTLVAELRDSNVIEFMKEIFSLSYNKLPYNVKCCFLYFSIFPEDHPIDCPRLIRLLVAERFAEVMQERTAEEVAEGYIKLLLDRNLIQVAESTTDGRIRACRVHDILHKISILKSRDQNFAVVAKQKDSSCPTALRRLSIHNSLQNIQHIKTISQLRSFFLFGLSDSLSKTFIRTSFPESITMLNVLDLEEAPLEIFPDDIVKLTLLKYLSLRRTKVKIIPPSISKLRNLQTLDLKYTFVSKLPVTILKLKNLHHLLVYRYEIEPYASFKHKFGFEIPGRIGELESLQKLNFVVANRENLMKDIGKLKELRRLGIIKLRREYGNALCSSIQKLSKLRALSITAVDEEEILDIQYKFFPPRYLQRLYLNGRMIALPEWIGLLDGLVKLCLRASRLTQDPFVHLQKLPNLVHLELLQVFNGESLCFAAGGFQKLKILGVDKFEELKSILMEKDAMSCLEILNIQRCSSLKKIPSGIEHLTQLKVLQFFDIDAELIRTINPNQQGEDCSRVAHIPQIYSKYWRGGGVWDIQSLGRFRGGESSSNSQVEIKLQP